MTVSGHRAEITIFVSSFGEAGPVQPFDYTGGELGDNPLR
jgi:hypothetical protein